MPLSCIVVVVLRLFAIQTLLKGIDLALRTTASLPRGPSLTDAHSIYVAAAALVVFAVLEWLLAPAIGRLTTRGYDAYLSLSGLTRIDLYSFGFVFLGLYFVLSSIGSSMTWVHYFLVVSATGGDSASDRSFYDLAAPLIELIGGFFALIFARTWARRLSELEREKA